MEEYDGVAILATNMRHQMDDAFLRPLTFNVVSPLPEADDRVRIWAAAWPA
jgi:SpoVK/Ycf46/Vps4 family AAA+-type ATPase